MVEVIINRVTYFSTKITYSFYRFNIKAHICVGHNSGPEGGEFPPPAIPPIHRVSTLGSLERPTPIHGDVLKGSRKETQGEGVRGVPCGSRRGILVLWTVIGGDVIIQMPRGGYLMCHTITGQ